MEVWLLENDTGYTVYLIKNQQKEEAARVFVAEGHSKDSSPSFVNYVLSFEDIQFRHSGAASQNDQMVGFGSRASCTWREIWDSRDDGFAAFILRKIYTPGASCYNTYRRSSASL